MGQVDADSVVLVDNLNYLPRLETKVLIHAPDKVLQSHALLDIKPDDCLSMLLPCRIRDSVCSIRPLEGDSNVLGRAWGHGELS
jgi:hypothetical protein